MRDPHRVVVLCLAAIGAWGPAYGADTDDTAIEEVPAPVKLCPVPDRVRVGAYVNSVAALDLATRTFEFDGYLWFKWCNPALDPGSTLDFLNAADADPMTVAATYAAPVELDGGVLYQVIRVRGRFSTPLPLRDYPFDRQLIGPVFEDGVHNVGDLVYELDPDGVSMNPKLGMPGYIVGAARLDFVSEGYPTRFGDTRATEGPIYARAAVRVPLVHPIVSQLARVVAPIAAIAVCAGIAFARHGSAVSRSAVGSVAMLALVALGLVRLALPDVGYLTVIDEVVLATAVYVVTGFGVVVRGAVLAESGRESDGETLHHIGITAASSIYVVVCSLLIGFAIVNG